MCADDVDRLSLKISAQTISVAQNYSQHSPSEDEFNWLYHAKFKFKLINVSFKEKKDEKKLALPKFLLLPEKSELTKICEAEGWGVDSLPAPPYAHGCYHIFLSSNTLKFQLNLISLRRVCNLYHH